MKLSYKVLPPWCYVVVALAVILLAIRFSMYTYQESLLERRKEYLAHKGGGKLVEAKIEAESPNAKRLIIVVHAYAGSDRSMKDVIAATKDKCSDADVVLMDYPANRFSNADCATIAKEICDQVTKRSDKYQDIILVGYSMGALLARKAYVYGWGHTEDFGGNDKTVTLGKEEKWVRKVRRFVLLAGMNRGWSTTNRPGGMSAWKQLVFQTGKFIGWSTNTGHLIRQCERGTPFVANLRMQWLDVMHDHFGDEHKPIHQVTAGEAEATLKKEDRPTVIQLLGSEDDIVTDEDSRDASVSRGFVWVQLSNTQHGNAADFTGEKGKEDIAKARREWFVQALGSEDEVNRLRRMSPKAPSEDDPEITEAVVVLHGIRDYGFWTADFFSPLQETFLEGRQEKGKLLVYRPSYGYFPMGSFLLPIERQEKVRWFMDEMTELKAKYPELKTIHFVGHSNGTYVLAQALKDYRALKVGRVVLAGSVLPEQFDWVAPNLTGRVAKVHNFAATGDWVVAFFPHLFEISPFSLLKNSIGGAGHNGFSLPQSAEGDPGKAEAWKQLVSQTMNVEGGHGAALGIEGIEAMKRFVLKGDEIVRNPNPGERSKVVAFFGYVPWLVWLGIIAVLWLLGRLWYIGMSRFFGIFLKPKAAKVAAIVAYCLSILFVLETA